MFLKYFQKNLADIFLMGVDFPEINLFEGNEKKCKNFGKLSIAPMLTTFCCENKLKFKN
jgi:hypothetical protein